MPAMKPAEEQAALDQAKMKALEDPQVRTLKDKIHDARSDEEQRKASEAYTKALYEKVRQNTPPILRSRVDGEESNALKKLR
jgi:hypothetical protein